MPDQAPHKAKNDAVSLSDGEALTYAAAASITRAEPTRIIVVAGAEASGKTTLITTIYESFQNGPFAGFLFAGSETLVGFEQRCYRARIQSGAAVPDTDRTRVGEERLLHLAIRDQRLESQARQVLIADLAGEVFRLATDSTAECRKLSILKRADCLVVLIDGSKIATPRTRSDSAVSALSLIRSCLDAEMLGTDSFLSVVIAKWDDVIAAGDEAISYVDQLFIDIQSRFGSRVRSLSRHRIAARPQRGRGLEFGFGCTGLFAEWVTLGAMTRNRPFNPLLPEQPEQDEREMARFAAFRSGHVSGR